MGRDAADEPSTDDRRAAPGLRFRADLQGLRAVAVLLVVLDHAGVPFLRGGYVGVDVFFVLSGFLITGLLLGQAARDGRVSLPGFYVRRARRILPAAVLTLLATDVAAYYLLNFVRARAAVSDSIWASLFAANFHFAHVRADYFAAGQPPSPVQHFWSLSIEEQFYLAWPLLLSVALFGALRRRPAAGLGEAALHRALAVVLLLGVASLAWSIHATAADHATAYFSTFPRVWELALGAALAIAARRLTGLPRALTACCGWIGLACIGSAAVAFSATTHFPGYAALLPTAGAVLVIGAGIGGHSRLAAGRVLAIRPFRYVGDRSYALYLWHWPVLVIALDYTGHALPTGTKLLLLFGAFLLSILSYATVENPIRHMRWRPRTGILLWPASAAVVLALAAPLLASTGRTAARIEAASAAVTPATIRDPAVHVVRTRFRALPAVRAAVREVQRGAPLPSPLVPAVGLLHNDWFHFPQGCSAGRGQTSSTICHLGATGSRKTVVVYGDSHAWMWMGAILRMASRDGWQVVPLIKPSCIPRRLAESNECARWYQWVVGRMAVLRPTATLVIGSWAEAFGPRLAVKPVLTVALTMQRYSVSVIVVGDAPGQIRDPADCVLAPRSTMATCSRVAAPAQLKADNMIAARAHRRGVGFISTRGWFCAHPSHHPARFVCPLVVNRTITAVNRGHVSQTYALELAPSFRAAFRRELFR